MWLAGTAMLLLSAGYLLLVVVSGKIRTGREQDPAVPQTVDETADTDELSDRTRPYGDRRPDPVRRRNRSVFHRVVHCWSTLSPG